MKIFRRIAFLLILSLFLLACSGGSEEPEAATTSSPTSASGFPSINVAKLDEFIAKNTGTPTMVLFWTTWCPSCKQEIPELEALNKSHGDKVNVMAVSLDENAQALKQFFNGKKLDLAVYHGDEALGRKFEVEAIPTLIIFDKTGKMVFSQAGVFPHSMLERMIDGLTK